MDRHTAPIPLGSRTPPPQGVDGDDGGGSLDAADHGRARLAMLVRKEAEERRRARIVK